MGENRFEYLLSMLPEGWEEKAKELGALRRAREVKSAEELLRLILLYLTEGKSFAGTSALIQLGGEARLNKMAVYKRMRNSGAWLQWLCENLYRRAGLVAEKPLWLKDRNVCLFDGSESVKCGVRRQCYRLHYSLELFTLGLREFLVTGMETGEQTANYVKLGKADIVVADRAYGTLPGISYLKRRRCGFVLRLRGKAFTMYDRKKQKTELLERLQDLPAGKIKSITVWYRQYGRFIPLRICALRKDEAGERAGLKRLTKENQRKRRGKAVSEGQREYNKYIIVATSLGKEEVTTGQVMELYRMRWQIEIAFKRLKSLFGYNDLPAQKSASVRAWFYGKLLLAALCETMVNTGRFSPCGTGSRKSAARSVS